MVCSVCGAVHHADCWQDNAGCAITACTGGPGGIVNRPIRMDSTPTIDQAVGRPPHPESIASATPSTWSPTVAVSSRNRRDPSLAIAIVILALVVGGAAAAFVLSRQDDNSVRDVATQVRRSKAKAHHAANRTGTSQTITRTVTVPVTASPTTKTERGPMSWPVGFAGYTVALASDRLRSDALGAATKARSAGLGDVGVIWSSRYSSLTPGYWFVWSGIYTLTSEAERDVAQAEDAGFAGAYVRRIAE